MTKRKRLMLYIVGGLYLVTWIWGVPAVHTKIARKAVADYHDAAKMKRGAAIGGPRVRFGASYVILPFITVNHYEYMIAGEWGWGGLTVDVWYLTDSVAVFGINKWMS